MVGVLVLFLKDLEHGMVGVWEGWITLGKSRPVCENGVVHIVRAGSDGKCEECIYG